MEQDERHHLLAVLRREPFGPVTGMAPVVLRRIEEIATELLADVPPPVWDRAARDLFQSVGAPFEKPVWDLTGNEPPFGIGALLAHLRKASAEEGEGAEDLARWRDAGDVLRACLQIREHGLTRGSLDWLTDGLWNLPVRRLRDEAQPAAAQAVQAEAQPRLVLSIPNALVLIDGAPQAVPTQPFRLLRELMLRAINGPALLRYAEIGDLTGRVPKEIVGDLRDALSRGRSNAEEIRGWIGNRRAAGYLLELPIEDLRVEE